MAKLFDLMVPQGEYTDNTGQQKTRWLKIGAIFTTQQGKQAMKLDCMPLNADFDGWVQMFTPNQPADNLKTANAPAPQGGYRETQPKGQNTGSQPNPNPNPAGEYEDDIPF